MTAPVFTACAALAALLIAGSAQQARAQEGLREGLKVRLSFPQAPRLTGVIHSITDDSVFLFVAPSATRVGIARRSVQSVEVSHGRSVGRGAKKGALWGAGIFGGLGTVFAIAMASDSAVSANDNGVSPAAFALVAIAEGAGIGALIGAFVKSERWQSASVTPSAGIGTNGFRVGVRIRGIGHTRR